MKLVEIDFVAFFRIEVVEERPGVEAGVVAELAMYVLDSVIDNYALCQISREHDFLLIFEHPGEVLDELMHVVLEVLVTFWDWNKRL